MNKKIATIALGFLTFGSLSVASSMKVEAFAHSSNPLVIETTTSPTQPIVKTDLVQNQSAQQVAYNVYCETYTDGYQVATCCIDSYGNWSCVW
ncbi:MAG: hypothetical protein Kow00121_36500 [Elainellaceae cyanobacterium]